jgi:hypothetical protein
LAKRTEDGFDESPNEITIYYNEDPPASGKSEFFKRLIAGEPGRYLMAVPTQKLLGEHAGGKDGLRQRLAAAGLPHPVEVVTISTATHARSVRRALAEAADLYRDRQHVVVVCTHAALMTTDLSGFAGWTLLIDEVPDVVACGTWRTGASLAQFRANYTLVRQPGEGGWSRVAVRTDAPGPAMVAADDLVGGSAAFHRRALSRSGVYANLAAWEEVESGAEWSWWSVWEAGELAAFDRVMLVGNAFSHSVTRRLMEERPGEGWRAEFRRFELPGERRERAPRRLAIRYFTEHPGSTTFWAGHPDGQRCIQAVAEWIARNAPAGSHMFASNRTVEPVLAQARVLGLRLTPCVAGSNDYDDFEHASILFSAKLTPQEEKALALFGIDAEEVRRSREFEAILQFCFRCIIRKPEFNGTCFWNVYDGEQARFLKAFVEEHGLAEVELQYVDVGIGDIARPQKHRRLVGEAAAAREAKRRKSNTERVRAHRERKKAEKVERGTYRGRGRPRKSDGTEASP